LDVVVRQDLLRWIVRESNDRGATVIYATHIFDGLDDWATHLLYLTDRGRCGWEGPVEALPLYRQLAASASDGSHHPAKMLTVAEAWLRAEWNRRKTKRQREKAMGAGALLEEMNVTDRSQGGYASGRMRIDADYDDHNSPPPPRNAANGSSSSSEPQPCRLGRLSDIMGNRGVLDKVSRVAADEGSS
jgi:CCR4-NOT complex subunit CAF16